MPQPEEEMFKEWLGHPVTEWIWDILRKQAAAQQGKWAQMAWEGDLDPLLHREAHVRADCYLVLPDSTYEDWIANDSEV